MIKTLTVVKSTASKNGGYILTLADNSSATVESITTEFGVVPSKSNSPKWVMKTITNPGVGFVAELDFARFNEVEKFFTNDEGDHSAMWLFPV